MAEHSWPSSVPGPELSSVRWRPAFDNVIRSQMDGGSKSRRRATAVPEIMTCRLWLSAAQLQTLMDFYQITLREVEAFDWNDFRRPNDTTRVVTYTFRSYPQHGPWTVDSFWVDLELAQHTTFQGKFLLDVAPLTT